MFCHFVLTTKTTQPRPQVFSVICSIIWQFCFTIDVSFHISQSSSKFGGQHPRKPRGTQSRREKRRDESFQVQAKEPLAELLPKIQADAGSWLGTKNALYYCAQSSNSFSWDLFVSSYTTAIVSITACLAHAPKKCKQSGNFVWYKIPIWSQDTVCPKTKDAFPKIEACAYNRYSRLHRSRLA